MELWTRFTQPFRQCFKLKTKISNIYLPLSFILPVTHFPSIGSDTPTPPSVVSLTDRVGRRLRTHGRQVKTPLTTRAVDPKRHQVHYYNEFRRSEPKKKESRGYRNLKTKFF